MTSTTATKQGSDQAPALPPLKLVRTFPENIELMEGWLKRKGRGRALRILEAGCGNHWPLNLDGIQYALVGVDVDARALEIRKASARPGDEIRYGDLRNRELFGAAQFDAIYNSFVLEHVAGAEHVLENFAYWLAPGGLLILRIPDRDSVFGFVARTTPFWCHVFYKKYAKGNRNAGKPGFDPYPTVYDRIVSRQGIHDFCRARGLVIRDEAGYADYLPRGRIFGPLSRVLVRTISVLSLGRLDGRYNNLTLVIEK
jgi:SAM-dependent methyltransferase